MNERQYYESQGPLSEGHKGRWHKPTWAKHKSVLAVRLTGNELTQLRDVAYKRGIGPSTYARQLIIEGLKKEG